MHAPPIPRRGSTPRCRFPRAHICHRSLPAAPSGPALQASSGVRPRQPTSDVLRSPLWRAWGNSTNRGRLDVTVQAATGSSHGEGRPAARLADGATLGWLVALGSICAAGAADAGAIPSIAAREGGITLPMVAAMLLTATAGHFCVPLLRRVRASQTVRENGPKAHLSKAGTPTAGGLFVIPVGLLVGVLASGGLQGAVLIAVAGTAAMAAIGFADDFLKISERGTRGLPGEVPVHLPSFTTTRRLPDTATHLLGAGSGEEPPRIFVTRRHLSLSLSLSVSLSPQPPSAACWSTCQVPVRSGHALISNSSPSYSCVLLQSHPSLHGHTLAPNSGQGPTISFLCLFCFCFSIPPPPPPPPPTLHRALQPFLAPADPRIHRQLLTVPLQFRLVTIQA